MFSSTVGIAETRLKPKVQFPVLFLLVASYASKTIHFGMIATYERVDLLEYDSGLLHQLPEVITIHTPTP